MKEHTISAVFGVVLGQIVYWGLYFCGLIP